MIPLNKRFHAKVCRGGVDDCWLWNGAHTMRGYGQIRAPGRGRRLLAHRLAYELEFGAIPTGFLVLHHCDNPPCVNPRHLFLGTLSDNNKQPYLRGRGHPPSAKITPQIADSIRQDRIRENLSTRTLTRKYDLSYAHINRIIRGACWGEPNFT